MRSFSGLREDAPTRENISKGGTAPRLRLLLHKLSAAMVPSPGTDLHGVLSAHVTRTNAAAPFLLQAILVKFGELCWCIGCATQQSEALHLQELLKICRLPDHRDYDYIAHHNLEGLRLCCLSSSFSVGVSNRDRTAASSARCFAIESYLPLIRTSYHSTIASGLMPE